MRYPLLLSALVALGSANPVLVERQGQTCYSGVYIITARGTFEMQDLTGFGLQGTLVTSILNAIPNSNASAVIYSASVVNYGQSVQGGAINAQKQIVDYNKACPNSKIVLLGYSQGAQVIGNALTGGGTGIPVLGGTTGDNTGLSPSLGANIIALNLIGDPNRLKGQGIDSDPKTCSTSSSAPRSGLIAAAFQLYSGRLATWCHQGDPVCCSDGSDPGSHIAYLFSPENIAKMTQFVKDKYTSS